MRNHGNGSTDNEEARLPFVGGRQRDDEMGVRPFDSAGLMGAAGAGL